MLCWSSLVTKNIGNLKGVMSDWEHLWNDYDGETPCNLLHGWRDPSIFARNWVERKIGEWFQPLMQSWLKLIFNALSCTSLLYCVDLMTAFPFPWSLWPNWTSYRLPVSLNMDGRLMDDPCGIWKMSAIEKPVTQPRQLADSSKNLDRPPTLLHEHLCNSVALWRAYNHNSSPSPP